LLFWLADQHGLRGVFDEGIDQQTLPQYRESIQRGRRETSSWRELINCLTELRRQIDTAEANGLDATSLRAQKVQLEKRRLATRAAGAVAQLLLKRPFVEVWAAEDKEALANASRALRNARNREGFENYIIANVAREQAIVRNLLDHGTCSVIVLGGAHDLSHQIDLLSDGRCEYVKVLVKGYPEPKRQSRLYRSKRGMLFHAASRAKVGAIHFMADPQNGIVLVALLIFPFIIVARRRTSA
jgi:hypothetical protein